MEPVFVAGLRGLAQERIIISENVEIEDIAVIIEENFVRDEPVEIQLINMVPTIRGVPFDMDPEQANRLFLQISQILTNTINDMFPSLKKWSDNIPFVSFETNNLMIRWRAKTSISDFPAGLIHFLTDFTLEVGWPMGAIIYLDPISDWPIDNIIIYKYSEQGVGETDREELDRKGLLIRVGENFLILAESINRYIIQQTTLGVPNIIWVAGAIIIIPEVLRTIRRD